MAELRLVAVTAVQAPDAAEPIDGYLVQSPQITAVVDDRGQVVVILPDAEEAPALRDDPRVFVPAYLGASGWLGVDLDADTDWDEIAELLDAFYRLTAPKRSIAALDACAP